MYDNNKRNGKDKACSPVGNCAVGNRPSRCQIMMLKDTTHKLRVDYKKRRDYYKVFDLAGKTYGRTR